MFKCCTLEVFNITEHVQGVQYLLHCWCSNFVLYLNTCKRSVPSDQLVFFLVKPFSTWCSNSVLSLLTLWCSILQNTFKAFNICCDFGVQMVFYTLTPIFTVLYSIYFAFSGKIPMNNSSFKLKAFTNAPLETFYLWWESFFNGGHFSTCQTRKKSTPVTFFLHTRHVFLRPGVISLRRKMTPRSIFDGGRYSSLHRNHRIKRVVPCRC